MPVNDALEFCRWRLPEGIAGGITMTTGEMLENVLVLRKPEPEGNFRYWVAELTKADARRWEERLNRPDNAREADLGGTFGGPLTLPQVMEKLQARDFRVLDFPCH